MTYDSDYEVRLATLEAMGGDVTKKYDSVYEIDLEILNIIQHGGGGEGARIDDDNVSTATTWSSSKIVSELANAGFDIEIVTELPTTGDPHTIYFIASSSSQTGNVYDEYMYISGNWEQVGSTAVDLSNYATKSDISTFITMNDVSTFAEKSYVDASLALKQNVLTAGTGIDISNNIISTTNNMRNYVIADADASNGIYTSDTSAFYQQTISENNILNVKIKITNTYVVNNESVNTDSYYWPSSSRIYDGFVELWLMYTEDGQSWQNNHYLITSNSISKDVSTGYYGVNPSVLNDISTALNTILNGNQNS